MKILLHFFLAFAFAVMSGAVISVAVGTDFGVMASIFFIFNAIISPLMPQNALFAAVVFKTAYVDELLTQLQVVKNTFLARVPNVSHLLEANTINYSKIGAKPNVLIDNATYPIPSVQRTDEGLIVYLRKLTTEGTIITRSEIHNLPYDKKNSVIAQHKESLLEKFYSLALYSFTPSANTTTTPVLVTTGADDGTGRKRLTQADLIKFRTALSNLGVAECDLVLSNEHAEDIMLWSQVFANQYHAIASGLVLPLYGFNITQYVGYAPTFNTGTKKAFGAVSGAGDKKASVAFMPKRMFQAYGSVEMFFTPATAKYHQDEVNFDAYFIAAPKDSEGAGAIISG